MADLKCVVENCTYNKDCLCSKGDIMVGGKHACDCDGTCCESFAQKRGKRIFQQFPVSSKPYDQHRL